MRKTALITLTFFLALSLGGVQVFAAEDPQPKCMKRKTEANCYVEFFNFHAATEIASKKDSDQFMQNLNLQTGGEITTRSAVLDASVFLVDNLSSVLVGQGLSAASLTSLSGLNLIHGILTGFVDTRLGMSPNMHLSFNDDQLNTNPSLFVEAYKPKFLEALSFLSEEDVEPVTKTSKTVFGVIQHQFGGIIQSKICPGSSAELTVKCIFSSNALSSAMNGRSPKSGEFKGREKHYRIEHFQIWNLDWTLATPTRSDERRRLARAFPFRISELMPGEFYNFIPKSKSQPVGYFYDGRTVMPYAYRE